MNIYEHEYIKIILAVCYQLKVHLTPKNVFRLINSMHVK